MQVAIERTNQYVTTSGAIDNECEVINVTVSGLTMRELLEITEKNFSQHLSKRKVHLCSLVAIEAFRQASGTTEDVAVSVPANSSLAMISGVANNLSLNKKTRMVLSTALNNPARRNSYTLVGISGSKTWTNYVGPVGGTRDDLIEVRLKMVREAFKNNPDYVFPDMTYIIYS